MAPNKRSGNDGNGVCGETKRRQWQKWRHRKIVAAIRRNNRHRRKYDAWLRMAQHQTASRISGGESEKASAYLAA